MANLRRSGRDHEAEPPDAELPDLGLEKVRGPRHPPRSTGASWVDEASDHRRALRPGGRVAGPGHRADLHREGTARATDGHSPDVEEAHRPASPDARTVRGFRTGSPSARCQSPNERQEKLGPGR